MLLSIFLRMSRIKIRLPKTIRIIGLRPENSRIVECLLLAAKRLINITRCDKTRTDKKRIQNNKILQCSKFKAFVDHKVNVVQQMKIDFLKGSSNVRKGEKTRHQQCLQIGPSPL